MRTLELTVTPAQTGRRVKSLLHNALQIPEGMIAAVKLRETGITRNGVRCRTSDTVCAGDVLRVEVGDLPAETGIVPMPYPLDILFEDEDVLAVNKPAGMATHGRAERGDITLANALAGKTTLTETQLLAADTDGSGNADVADLHRLLQHLTR